MIVIPFFVVKRLVFFFGQSRDWFESKSRRIQTDEMGLKPKPTSIRSMVIPRAVRLCNGLGFALLERNPLTPKKKPPILRMELD